MSSLRQHISRIHRQQIYFILLALFILSFPTTFNWNSRVIIALALFFFIDTHDNIISKIRKVRANKLIYLFFFYFIIQCIGLTYTDDISRGLNIITRLSPLVVLPLIIMSEKLEASYYIKLFNVLKFSLVYTIFYILFYQFYILDRPIGETVHFALEKIGISQHYIGVLLVIAIMIITHQLYNKTHIIVNSLLAVLLLAFLLILSSRSSLLILVFCLIIFFIKHFNHYNLGIKLSIVALGLSISVIGFYSSPELRKKADILIKTTDLDLDIIKTKNSITFVKNTFEQRVMINLASLKIIKKNPVFGVGTGDYLSTLEQEYKKLNFIAGIKEKFNAHNQYLEDYIKTGVLGFISFLLIILTLIRYGYKNKSYLFYCVLCVTITCLFESFLVRHHGTAFLSFFIFLFYKYEQETMTH